MAFVKSADCEVNRLEHEWSNTRNYKTDHVGDGGITNQTNQASPINQITTTNQRYDMDCTKDADGKRVSCPTLHDVLPDLMASLYAYCMSLTKSVTETEDLVQETCLKGLSSEVVQASERSDTSFNWEAYLIRIARNTWIDGIRRQEKLRSILAEMKPVMSECTEEESFEELESAVQLLVHTLPPWQRAIYILREILGYKAAETAEMLRTTEGAVKAALNRARTAVSKVRHNLQEAGIESAVEQGTMKEPADLEQEQLRNYLMAFRQGDAARLIDLCLNRMDDPMAVAGTILQQVLPSQAMQPVMYGYATSSTNSMNYGRANTVIMAA
ncbi:RNA polymerase sigma factor [Paenibacillus polysaccharolyticus]|uniref:RNA polymerase sigma factor n=1 Tax=Paenibacillus polysaccharolyticus TaxID=582692 RepID=UPI00204166C9|nr:RNA polymerase sigma factor [Paenibacillus polysaccharolyticus]MCM3135464.1 RNA polymerase sigma factor [Paenibacillus polysaccharolyticus]